MNVMGQVLAGITVICYLIGLLTVNLYLQILGVSALLDPFKIRFIYTGVLVLASLSFSFIFPLYFINLIITKSVSMFTKWMTSILAIAFPALAYLTINYVFVFIVNSPNSLIFRPILTLKIILLFSLFSFLAGGIIFFILLSTIPTLKSVLGVRLVWQKNHYSLWLRLVLGFSLIPVISLYLTYFGHNVYPLVPEQFGGGQPQLVQFLFKPDSIDSLRSLGLDVDNKGLSETSQTLVILFEEGSDYVLGIYEKNPSGETRNGKTIKGIIRVDKELVIGMRLRGENHPRFGTMLF